VDLFAFVSRCFNSYDHKKLEEMKKILDAMLPFFGTVLMCLGGCAHKEQPHYTPPSSVRVQQNVARVGQYVKPEGKSAYLDLEKSIADYQKQVEDQTIALAKAQDDAAYWHTKQEKALKELWTWRLMTFSVIICVVVYIGIKTSWRFLL
jgi:hypothetical protein